MNIPWALAEHTMGRDMKRKEKTLWPYARWVTICPTCAIVMWVFACLCVKICQVRVNLGWPGSTVTKRFVI